MKYGGGGIGAFLFLLLCTREDINKTFFFVLLMCVRAHGVLLSFYLGKKN